MSGWSCFKGMFAGRQLQGRDWVRRLSEEDRKVWASLGRMALSERDINWHALGGKSRPRCPECGCFMRTRGLRKPRCTARLCKAGHGSEHKARKAQERSEAAEPVNVTGLWPTSRKEIEHARD